MTLTAYIYVNIKPSKFPKGNDACTNWIQVRISSNLSTVELQIWKCPLNLWKGRHFTIWATSSQIQHLIAPIWQEILTMWETWVQSLGREFPLEKEMATHSSTLTWKIPRMEDLGRLQSMGSQRVRHDGVTSLHWLSHSYSLSSS